MEGRRVEAVIDSLEVLELLDQLSRGEKPGHVEFAFRKNGTLKYFEVAGATLSKPFPRYLKKRSTFFCFGM